jgi:hypothetical protein
MWNVSRLESMSPNGFLRLHVQEDGDICVQVGEGDADGGIRQFASIEICTPMAGGGGSPRTHEALRQLAIAMAEDNADEAWRGRAGEFDGAEILKYWKP